MDITKLVEQLLKLGTAIAAVGYIILRAHINYLGFSSMDGFQPDRYLMEAYGFLGIFVFILGQVAALMFLAYFIYIIIDGRFRGRHFYLKSKFRLKSAANHLFQHPGVTHLVLFIYCALFVFALDVVRRWSALTSVLIGLINPKNVEYYDYSVHFTILCGAIGLGYIYYRCKLRHRSAEREANEKFSLQALRLFLIGLCALLPVIYGLRVRPPGYPHAQMQLKESGSLEGDLVMEDDSKVRVWTLVRLDSGWEGQEVSVQKSEIRSLSLGNIENLLVVASNAVNPRPSPTSASK